MFDATFKGKKEVLKFKHLLTQYLPNQMAIFSNDYSTTHYINNAFRRCFRCPNVSQVKDILEKFVIEKETIEKYKNLFINFGYNANEEDDQPFTLSSFMAKLSQNFDMLREAGTISIPVTEIASDNILQFIEPHNKEEILDRNLPKTSKDSAESQTNLRTKETQETRKTLNPISVDINDSHINERGSGKSWSSEVIYEEGTRRVFKVKIFPLMWDEFEAIAMVLDDITQQKIIMELKMADRNKDLVIAMVSHELRTPLNGMLGSP